MLAGVSIKGSLAPIGEVEAGKAQELIKRSFSLWGALRPRERKGWVTVPY